MLEGNLDSAGCTQYSSSIQPTLFHTTCLKVSVTDVLRERRAYALHASSNPEKPISIDYIMEIERKGTDVKPSGSSCCNGRNHEAAFLLDYVYIPMLVGAVLEYRFSIFDHYMSDSYSRTSTA
jgi:hypothetical protein